MHRWRPRVVRPLPPPRPYAGTHAPWQTACRALPITQHTHRDTEGNEVRCTDSNGLRDGVGSYWGHSHTRVPFFPSPGWCVIIGVPMGLSACWHRLGFLPPPSRYALCCVCAFYVCYSMCVLAFCVLLCLCVVVPVLPRVVRRRPRSPRSR